MNYTRNSHEGTYFPKDVFIQRAQEFIKAKKVKLDQWDTAEQFGNAMYDLYDALYNDRSVFAVCVKSPRGNLDTGKHYYDVHFVDGQGIVRVFWPGKAIMRILGSVETRPEWYLRGMSWCSGAIGMSRLLDATDAIFALLESWVGMYAQINSL